MTTPNLYQLRQNFEHEEIMLCFNGPISHSLIEEIGNALKSYMLNEHASLIAVMDVFSVYIELTQNIRFYASQVNFPGSDEVTVVVSHIKNGHYLVSAGNKVEAQAGQALLMRLQGLSKLTANELKTEYKKQLKKPRDRSLAGGAGLGLIDMSRKASLPLVAKLEPLGDGKEFYSVYVTV